VVTVGQSRHSTVNPRPCGANSVTAHSPDDQLEYSKQNTWLFGRPRNAAKKYSFPGVGRRQIADYTKFGSNPGGGRPTFTRCRKILRTSSGSVITVRIRIGEPHRVQVKGAPGRAALIHLSDEPCPGAAAFLG